MVSAANSMQNPNQHDEFGGRKTEQTRKYFEMKEEISKMEKESEKFSNPDQYAKYGKMQR